MAHQEKNQRVPVTDFGRRLCCTLVAETLCKVELELADIKSVRFLADCPWPPGKQLRPITFLLAYLSVAVEKTLTPSTDGRESRLAAAIELMHEASLVHDDLVDRNLLRRGEGTVQTVRGDGARPILIGDYMVFRGLKLVLDAARSQQDIVLARGSWRTRAWILPTARSISWMLTFVTGTRNEASRSITTLM